MISVRQCTIIVIDVRDDLVHQALTKARTGRCIPVPIVGKDKDERKRLAGEDQLIRCADRAEADPLIVGGGLSV